MATVAQTLIDLHIDSLKAFDREINGLIERSVAPVAAATLPRCDYEATRQRLYSDFITGPLPEPIEYKPISYPATRGSYTAQGSIVVNFDVLREMQMSSEIAFGPFPSLQEIDAENDHPPYPRWEIRSPTAKQSPRDNHIELCKAAMIRRQIKMDEMRASADYPGTCDHTAALGQPYFDLADKQDRAGKRLIVMLRKRGTADDLSLARAIEVTAWHKKRLTSSANLLSYL